jgi:hypothetical protein
MRKRVITPIPQSIRSHDEGCRAETNHPEEFSE